MALHKIKDFFPDYQEHFGDHDILSYGFYAGNDKIGSVDDLLVDDDGRFRYLVVSTGAWIFGKKVLLPIGQARIDYNDHRVYSNGLSREQVENLPEYDQNAVLDYGYEDRVRNVYRAGSTTQANPSLTNPDLDRTASLDNPTPLDATPGLDQRVAATGTAGMGADMTSGGYNQNLYPYDSDSELYSVNERDHQTLRLYEERLVANKIRQKAGEVTVGKRVETETQRVSVPIEKERVVIERVNPTNQDAVASGVDAFQEGEVVRMDVYEETPDIRKEAFVREEVRVRKEIDHDTVEANETLRREELDIDKDGNPIIRE